MTKHPAINLKFEFFDVVPITRFEPFRALKFFRFISLFKALQFFRLEGFRALKFLSLSDMPMNLMNLNI